MSHTTDLLDQFKRAKNLESDYAAAAALGLRPNRLSNYRTGVSHADDKTAVILADALGLDRLKTIAQINIDRAKDAKERAFWRQIATAAAIALCAVVAPIVLAETLDNSGVYALALLTAIPSNVYYVKGTMVAGWPTCVGDILTLAYVP